MTKVAILAGTGQVLPRDFTMLNPVAGFVACSARGREVVREKSETGGWRRKEGASEEKMRSFAPQ